MLVNLTPNSPTDGMVCRIACNLLTSPCLAAETSSGRRLASAFSQEFEHPAGIAVERDGVVEIQEHLFVAVGD